MKKALLAATALAVAAAAVLTTTGGAQAPGERTLKFVEKGGTDKFVDNPPKQRRRNQPPSPGDEFLYSSPLYDETGTTRVGTVVFHCVIAPGKSLPTDCAGNATVKDGTVTFAGRAT